MSAVLSGGQVSGTQVAGIQESPRPAVARVTKEQSV